MKIAKVVDRDQTRTGMDEGKDVGWHEERIWRVLRHLPRETKVCPKAREWHDPPLAAAEEAGRGGITKVEAETMGAMALEKRLDEAPRVDLRPRRLIGDSAAGVDPD
jgi:hypothetical protein